MLSLQGITYLHPNKDVLFADLNLVLNKQDKIALTGNNGVGKSTLMQLLAGHLQPVSGQVKTASKPWYVPQLLGQFNKQTVAEALQVADRLHALQEILAGEVTPENMTVLNDDWTIEERCAAAFAHWQLQDVALDQRMETLSGGQRTKVFLAGIAIHRPDIVLLDEPSNHLDLAGRKILYDFIRHTTQTLLVVSHDRTLLNLLQTVVELSRRGITIYGGNYDFYLAQKIEESDALNQDLKNKEKALRKAKEKEKQSLERQHKLDNRGQKKQEKAGLPTISMNTFKNNAEKSTARMKGVHDMKVDALKQELTQLRETLPGLETMKVDFDQSRLHTGKVLINAEQLNFGYRDRQLWKQALDLRILSGDRISIQGPNGSGKTTLISLLLGALQPTAGTIRRQALETLYVDQNYSLIGDGLKVYEQAQQFNSGALQEHEVKIRLNRFLFTKEYWDKPCSALSGGEKMRLILCALTISKQAPDVIVLDEPTNNLDIQNIEILTAAIQAYRGTLLVVSHDAYFLEQIGIDSQIILP